MMTTEQKTALNNLNKAKAALKATGYAPYTWTFQYDERLVEAAAKLGVKSGVIGHEGNMYLRGSSAEIESVRKVSGVRQRATFKDKRPLSVCMGDVTAAEDDYVDDEMLASWGCL